MKSFWKNEKGAVVVFVALLMTVLLGMAALVVEYGFMLAERTSLQNTVDAAALAGVAEATDLTRMDAVAREYIQKNTSDVVSVQTNPSGNKLTVTVTKQVPAFFSVVLTGGTTNTISASATAEYKSDLPPVTVDYAIWANRKVELNSWSKVRGNINVNSNFPGAYTVGWASSHIGSRVSGQEMPDISFLTMPTYYEELPADAYRKVDYYSGFPYFEWRYIIYIDNSHLAKLEKDKIYYFKTSDPEQYTVRIDVEYGTDVSLHLIADCDIDVENLNWDITSLLLYSTTGDVDIPGLENAMNGWLSREKPTKVMIAAPHGNVDIGSFSYHVEGFIVSDSCEIGTNGYEFRYSTSILDDLLVRPILVS